MSAVLLAAPLASQPSASQQQPLQSELCLLVPTWPPEAAAPAPCLQGQEGEGGASWLFGLFAAPPPEPGSSHPQPASQTVASKLTVWLKSQLALPQPLPQVPGSPHQGPTGGASMRVAGWAAGCPSS